MSEMKTKILPVLPLGNGVLLPNMVVPLALETSDAKAAVTAAQGSDGVLIVVARVNGTYAPVGCVATIVNTGRTPGGTDAIVVRGLHRAVIGSGVPGTGDALWVQYEARPDPEESSERSHELAREYRALVENIVEARGVPEVAEFLRGITEPGAVADVAGYAPDLSVAQRIELLEIFNVEERLQKVIAWARDTLAEVTLKEKIHKDVAEGMDKSQREYLLRRQLEAIKKELGEISGEDSLVEEYRKKIAEVKMPEQVLKEAERELDRLERTSEQQAEHGWIRTYLDWLCEIPWSDRTEDRLELQEAKRILDEDHTGLEDVKERVLEYLSVRKLRAERAMGSADGRGSGAILTLVGPPGVGKTSLGESIARALGRRFTRMSLGGVRDEAEIRGHRRTYIGALPGRIVRGLKDAGSMNPVFMLDEIDKVGSDWRGDPASALLEVLDPAQNHTFKDHYLEVALDLSEVLFICTGNVVETVPSALLDRMEVIRLDGYTEYDKLAIARDHLLRRQIEKNGLRVDEVEITEAALRRVIGDYTREAGVRNLERELGNILRKVATRIATGETAPPVRVDEGDVRGHLGRQKFFFEVARRTCVPGVATGLSVTGSGGDVLFIEATQLDEPEDRSAGGLILTGQLGDVMKESGQIALSYVASHADTLGIDSGRKVSGRFHLHVPAGAIPKDGPSAGINMVTALVSLLTGRPVKPNVGMTGEVTLRGQVLLIGGVKQKVLAAHRAGLREVILPRRNEGDLEDVPESVLEQISFHLVESVDEVPTIALASEPCE